MAVAVTSPRRSDIKAGEAPWYRRWLPLIGVAVIVLYCLAPFFWMVVSSLAAVRPVRELDHPVAHSHSTNFADVFKPANGFSALC